MVIHPACSWYALTHGRITNVTVRNDQYPHGTDTWWWSEYLRRVKRLKHLENLPARIELYQQALQCLTRHTKVRRKEQHPAFQEIQGLHTGVSYRSTLLVGMGQVQQILRQLPAEVAFCRSEADNAIRMVQGLHLALQPSRHPAERVRFTAQIRRHI